MVNLLLTRNYRPTQSLQILSFPFKQTFSNGGQHWPDIDDLWYSWRPLDVCKTETGALTYESVLVLQEMDQLVRDILCTPPCVHETTVSTVSPNWQRVNTCLTTTAVFITLAPFIVTPWRHKSTRRGTKSNVIPCPLVLLSSLTKKIYFFQYFHTHSIS